MARRVWIGSALALLVLIAGVAAANGQGGQPPTTGWQLPPDADQKKNPLSVDEKLLATGGEVFKEKCARCHGAKGLGDGPDADPDARGDMDLTDPARAEQNSDGVVYYKVWNGRRRPRMPAFGRELTDEQAWAVVAFAQSLRRK